MRCTRLGRGNVTSLPLRVGIRCSRHGDFVLVFGHIKSFVDVSLSSYIMALLHRRRLMTQIVNQWHWTGLRRAHGARLGYEELREEMAWHSDYRCGRELQVPVLWCCLHFNAHPSLIQVLQHRYFESFAVLLALSFNGHTIAALFTNLLDCLWLARLKAWHYLSL